MQKNKGFVFPATVIILGIFLLSLALAGIYFRDQIRTRFERETSVPPASKITPGEGRVTKPRKKVLDETIPATPLTYEDNRIRFDYTSFWNLSVDKGYRDAGFGYTIGLSAKGTNFAGSGILIQVTPPFFITSPEYSAKLEEDFEDSLEKFVADIERQSATDIKPSESFGISGHPAKQVTYDSFGKRVLKRWTLLNRAKYEITLTAEPELFDELWEDHVFAIFDSFEILK